MNKLTLADQNVYYDMDYMYQQVCGVVKVSCDSGSAHTERNVDLWLSQSKLPSCQLTTDTVYLALALAR